MVVGVANFVLTFAVPRAYGPTHEITLGEAKPIVTQISSVAAIWAVEGALLLGILTVFVFAWRPVLAKFADGSKAAVAGALLASLNTASEYGFGGVIALLPGFVAIADALRAIPNPLINEAISVTVLAGITGSASGGMSIALAAMSDTFIAAAEAAKIPLEVLHRVASMASGGMDTLPHNGAVITLLAVTGLTHREAYKDIFVITLTKTAAVFFVIGVYYLTGILLSESQNKRKRFGKQTHAGSIDGHPITGPGQRKDCQRRRTAVRLIRDGDTIATGGLSASVSLKKLRWRWRRSISRRRKQHLQAIAKPRNLTLVYAAGQGDGKERGLNHLGHEGLVRRVIGGHWGLGTEAAAARYRQPDRGIQSATGRDLPPVP